MSMYKVFRCCRRIIRSIVFECKSLKKIPFRFYPIFDNQFCLRGSPLVYIFCKMLICRIKGSRYALSQGKYWNESKSRRMTEARGLPGSLYSGSTVVYTRTQAYAHPVHSYGSFLATRSVCEPFESSRLRASPCLGDGDGNGRIEG